MATSASVIDDATRQLIRNFTELLEAMETAGQLGPTPKQISNTRKLAWCIFKALQLTEQIACMSIFTEFLSTNNVQLWEKFILGITIKRSVFESIEVQRIGTRGASHTNMGYRIRRIQSISGSAIPDNLKDIIYKYYGYDKTRVKMIIPEHNRLKTAPENIYCDLGDLLSDDVLKPGSDFGKTFEAVGAHFEPVKTLATLYTIFEKCIRHSDTNAHHAVGVHHNAVDTIMYYIRQILTTIWTGKNLNSNDLVLYQCLFTRIPSVGEQLSNSALASIIETAIQIIESLLKIRNSDEANIDDASDKTISDDDISGIVEALCACLQTSVFAPIVIASIGNVSKVTHDTSTALAFANFDKLTKPFNQDELEARKWTIKNFMTTSKERIDERMRFMEYAGVFLRKVPNERWKALAYGARTLGAAEAAEEPDDPDHAAREAASRYVSDVFMADRSVKAATRRGGSAEVSRDDYTVALDNLSSQDVVIDIINNEETSDKNTKVKNVLTSVEIASSSALSINNEENVSMTEEEKIAAEADSQVTEVKMDYEEEDAKDYAAASEYHDDDDSENKNLAKNFLLDRGEDSIVHVSCEYIQAMFQKVRSPQITLYELGPDSMYTWSADTIKTGLFVVYQQVYGVPIGLPHPRSASAMGPLLLSSSSSTSLAPVSVSTIENGLLNEFGFNKLPKRQKYKALIQLSINFFDGTQRNGMNVLFADDEGDYTADAMKLRFKLGLAEQTGDLPSDPLIHNLLNTARSALVVIPLAILMNKRNWLLDKVTPTRDIDKVYNNFMEKNKSVFNGNTSSPKARPLSVQIKPFLPSAIKAVEFFISNSIIVQEQDPILVPEKGSTRKRKEPDKSLYVLLGGKRTRKLYKHNRTRLNRLKNKSKKQNVR